MVRFCGVKISEKSDNLLVQLLRYTLVGGIAFLVDYAMLYLLTERCNLHYLLSATLSFTAGLTVNYLMSVCWVFPHSKLHNRSVEFAVFALIGLAGLLLNDLLLYLFTDWLAVHYLLSKMATAALVLAWNFTVRKMILFK